MEFVTKADKEKLERQLADFRALDKALTERIAEARGHGDLRENSDYHAAREDKSMNNLRIRELEERIAACQVVQEGEMPTDMVFLGAVVQLRDEANGKVETFKIVSTMSETAVEYREVTTTSPMGTALMKARIGETVRVDLPKGERRLTIVAIVL
ncbi:MAG: transcription elongation factor GreA [Planctomycetes bacterium]|nr:transcription elongation factor GreA [Planctomycetota bacterium]